MEFYAYILLASGSLYLSYTAEDPRNRILASVFSIVFWIVCAIQHTYDYKDALSGLWWSYLLPITINVFLLFDGATKLLGDSFQYKNDPWEDT